MSCEHDYSSALTTRPKRLRKSPTMRAMLQEHHLSVHDFILPLFITAAKDKKAIQSLPGFYQLPLNALEDEIREVQELGLKAVLLFGIPETKDALGSDACHDQGIIAKAIRKIKSIAPELLVISDVCFCEYTDHGHCGVLEGEEIDNDKTLEYLAKQAVCHAKAGADWLAPSGMTDGMVAAIRHALDKAGFVHVSILSYAVKYASSLYGPFREAAEGAPGFGDRKTYQMNPANQAEALLEAELDISQGADLLMVKPAGWYLDVIALLKQRFPEMPLCAYQVSGEYAMIKFAAKQGLCNEEESMLESLLAIKRAGAKLIVSYFAKDIARYLKRSSD